jgi:1-acyl-sn-glycerol-3-phosphate acyltransferase
MTLILPRAFREDPGRYDGTSLQRRDAAYIQECMPYMEALFRYYFRVTARGFDRAPWGEPFLLVGNHSGGLNTPDTGMTMHAWYMQRGVEAPIFALVQREVFHVPYLNVHVMKLGGIAATARMAVKALESGAPLALYPGAGDDVYRPFEQRHTISFFGHDAFIRLALRFGLAIIPVVAIGSHETLLVFDDGRERAKRWGLDALGIERVPLTLSFPHGLSFGIPLNIPLPIKLGLEMGHPIRFSEAGPRSAIDAGLVKHCYERVVHTMQGMMDRLVREREAHGSPAGA